MLEAVDRLQRRDDLLPVDLCERAHFAWLHIRTRDAKIHVGKLFLGWDALVGGRRHLERVHLRLVLDGRVLQSQIICQLYAPLR